MDSLVRMLWDEQTIQAACLAIGRACERSHKGNQDALARVPGGAERLLELLEIGDEGECRAVHFAIFWAGSGATLPTRTYWERSRGFCMSLAAPKPAVSSMAERTCHRQSMADMRDFHR